MKPSDRWDLSRRGWLKSCAGALATFEARAQSHAAHLLPPAPVAPKGPVAVTVPEPKPSALKKFVDPLPKPPVIDAPGAGGVIEIEMTAARHRAHRDLPPTSLWGYNGMWPGPTIEARQGRPLSIKWINRLPTKHFLPIDFSIHGSGRELPEVRTVAHVHGARVMPESDGYPDAWVTSDGKSGPVKAANPAAYPNEQTARALWYHDHAMGITRLNVYAGLAGFYIIRDNAEDRLNLPSGDFEIPMMLQDRTFRPDGSLVYPVARNAPHPMWMQEFFGETITVNGTVWPYLNVEPRKYRFRILNASNARFYHLSLAPADTSGKVSGGVADAPEFQQIGSDAGLLPAPLPIHYLIVAPGERFDVVVDFSANAGQTFVMTNDAPAPYTRGGEILPGEVMLFRVAPAASAKDASALPAILSAFDPLPPEEAVRERMLAITERDRPSDGYTMIGLLGEKHWMDPVTEDPEAGSLEIWSFVNATGDVHPIHTHLVQFQVLNRQAFDVKTFLDTGKVMLIGRPLPPEANERPAWKDVVKTYPGYLTRVIQRFDLPSEAPVGVARDYRYVWHCHILEHEDNEMMRPYNVVARRSG